MSDVENNEIATGGCTGKGFRPGQSGNPGGRPKNQLITKQLVRLLKQRNPKTGKPYAEAVALGLMNQLAKGKNVKEILDRLEGPVPQEVEYTGSGGGPITLQFIPAERPPEGADSGE